MVFPLISLWEPLMAMAASFQPSCPSSSQPQSSTARMCLTESMSRHRDFDLYTTRFSLHNTGNSWIEYNQKLEEFLGKVLTREANLERHFTLLTILLPADLAQAPSEALAAFNHKAISLGRLIHPETIRLAQNCPSRSVALLRLIRVNLFSWIEDFEQLLPPAYSYLRYKEPAIEHLTPVYALLNNMLKWANPTSLLGEAILREGYEHRVSHAES